jgi:hypothetical protein
MKESLNWRKTLVLQGFWTKDYYYKTKKNGDGQIEI